jgi:hypothetical protein
MADVLTLPGVTLQDTDSPACSHDREDAASVQFWGPLVTKSGDLPMLSHLCICKSCCIRVTFLMIIAIYDFLRSTSSEPIQQMCPVSARPLVNMEMVATFFDLMDEKDLRIVHGELKHYPEYLNSVFTAYNTSYCMEWTTIPVLAAQTSPDKVITKFAFTGEHGDLSFQEGEVITVLKRTDNDTDWWTGRIGDREGSFPRYDSFLLVHSISLTNYSNYVEVISVQSKMTYTSRPGISQWIFLNVCANTSEMHLKLNAILARQDHLLIDPSTEAAWAYPRIPRSVFPEQPIAGWAEKLSKHKSNWERKMARIIDQAQNEGTQKTGRIISLLLVFICIFQLALSPLN